MKCVNIKHPEFIKLVKDSNIPTHELDYLVAKWQKDNNSDEFPTLAQILISDETSSPYINGPKPRILSEDEEKIKAILQKLYPKIKLAFSNKPIKDKNGNIIHSASLQTDITELKKAEGKKQELIENLQQFTENQRSNYTPS